MVGEGRRGMGQVGQLGRGGSLGASMTFDDIMEGFKNKRGEGQREWFWKRPPSFSLPSPIILLTGRLTICLGGQTLGNVLIWRFMRKPCRQHRGLAWPLWAKLTKMERGPPPVVRYMEIINFICKEPYLSSRLVQMTSHSAPKETPSPILNKNPLAFFGPRGTAGMQENSVFLYEPNRCIECHGDHEGHSSVTALNFLFQGLQWRW